MSQWSSNLDTIIGPVLRYAIGIEKTEPEKAAEIRRIAGNMRIELAQIEAIIMVLGGGSQNNLEK